MGSISCGPPSFRQEVVLLNHFHLCRESCLPLFFKMGSLCNRTQSFLTDCSEAFPLQAARTRRTLKY